MVRVLLLVVLAYCIEHPITGLAAIMSADRPWSLVGSSFDDEINLYPLVQAPTMSGLFQKAPRIKDVLLACQRGRLSPSQTRESFN